jgi:hypothetical protein
MNRHDGGRTRRRQPSLPQQRLKRKCIFLGDILEAATRFTVIWSIKQRTMTIRTTGPPIMFGNIFVYSMKYRKKADALKKFW